MRMMNFMMMAATVMAMAAWTGEMAEVDMTIKQRRASLITVGSIMMIVILEVLELLFHHRRPPSIRNL